MARTPNDNSVRQQVFAMLDGMMTVKRDKAKAAILSRFDIDQSYASSLYQTHRRSKIQSGVLIETFQVRDTKNGKPVKPKLVSHHKPAVESGDCTTAALAVHMYNDMMTAKINAASQLIK
jgi:hypothetical protein